MERGRFTAIAAPPPLRRAAFTRCALTREARLRRENAAGALLAFKAMADGDADRLAFAGQAKPSTAA
jgi:hypothetical protein